MASSDVSSLPVATAHDQAFAGYLGEFNKVMAERLRALGLTNPTPADYVVAGVKAITGSVFSQYSWHLRRLRDRSPYSYAGVEQSILGSLLNKIIVFASDPKSVFQVSLPTTHEDWDGAVKLMHEALQLSDYDKIDFFAGASVNEFADEAPNDIRQALYEHRSHFISKVIAFFCGKSYVSSSTLQKVEDFVDAGAGVLVLGYDADWTIAQLCAKGFKVVALDDGRCETKHDGVEYLACGPLEAVSEHSEKFSVVFVAHLPSERTADEEAVELFFSKDGRMIVHVGDDKSGLTGSEEFNYFLSEHYTLCERLIDEPTAYFGKHTAIYHQKW